MAAAYTTTDLTLPATSPTAPIPTARPARRRITPEAGRALEILGHAIEYLTDEMVHERSFLFAKNGQLEAVQLLMALNRQVYYECPVVLSFRERCLAFLGFRSA